MSEQTVFRVVHKSEYFSMARSSAQDRELSWEARGMLAYFLSKPDDWQVRVADLQQKCGRDKAKSILIELEEARYIRVERGQHNPESGEFATNVYYVYETPFTGNPSTVKPITVNPSLTYNRDVQSTEKNLSSRKTATGDNSPFEAKNHDASNENEIPKTNTKTPNPPPARAPRPRERDPIFDAVAEYIFGVTDPAIRLTMQPDETPEGKKKRRTTNTLIGVIKSWLKREIDYIPYGKTSKHVGYIGEGEIKPEHIKAFAVWYAQKHPNASMVTNGEKFTTYWRKWASSMKAKQTPRPTTAAPAPQPLNDAQKQQRQAELAAARKGASA